MNRVYVFFTIFFLSVINTVFSQLQVEWENRYNGVGSFIDNPACIVVDNQNNVYTAGNTFVNNTTNGYDAIIIKYDNEGNEIWQSTYSHGQKNDKISNMVIVNDFIYLLTKSDQDILTTKLKNPFAGIDAIDNSDKKLIFPNPAKEELHLNLPNRNIKNLIIYDITGKALINITKLQKGKTINVSNLSKGVYLITFASGCEVFVEKFVKK
jgi:hypothetical protein